MKKTIIGLTAMTMIAIAGCNNNTVVAGTTMNKPVVKVENGRFTPEVMWSLGKMGEKTVSPDGRKLVYAATYYNMEANKGTTNLYLVDLKKGNATTMLTNDAAGEWNPVWMDNNTLLFCRGNQIVKKDITSGAES